MVTINRLVPLICALVTIGGIPIGTAFQPSSPIPSLTEWGEGLPHSYSSDGREVPLDGTPYFYEYHPEYFGDGSGGEGGASGRAWVLKVTGTYCKIYIDSNLANPPNDTTLQNLANTFDTIIWVNDTATFGSSGYGSIDIAIYNFGDGLGGVGGYYSGNNDLYQDSADMSWADEIIAHEFQHCIHNSRDWNEDLWVNEGCSDLAIRVCFGSNASTLGSHLYSFEMQTDNDLTQFDNNGYDYGSAYAFLNYFYDLYGGAATINSLVGDSANGGQGFTNRLGGTGKDFTTVFRDWTVANGANNRTIAAVYGYKEMIISPEATWVNSYPYSLPTGVNRWAADYFRFSTNGEDLALTFNGSDTAPLEVYVGKIGRSGTPSAVEKMSLNGVKDGTLSIAGMGVNYSSAVAIVSASTATGTYTISATAEDHKPPVTTLSVSPALPNAPGGWYTTKPDITILVNEPKATSYYHWDSANDSSYAASFKAPEGEHTLYYHAVDFAGNVELARSITIKVDTTPPVTKLTADPASPNGRYGFYNSTPSITLSSEQGAVSRYSWDNIVEKNCTGPLQAPEGTNKLYYYSIDPLGNTELKKTQEFKVDTGKPVSQLTVDPETPDGLSGWYLHAPNIRMDTEPQGEILYRWDSETESRYNSPLVASEGWHTLTYYAMDRAGNREAAKQLVIKVDTLAPECAALADPASPDGENGIYRSNVNVTFNATHGVTVMFKLNSGSWTNATGAVKLPEGSSTVSYYAVDDAGNRCPEESLEFTVDTVPPITEMTVDPDIGLDWYGDHPGTNLRTENEARTYYFFDGGSPRLYSGRLEFPSGNHVLHYYSVDKAGNQEKDHERTFNVDLNEPVAKLGASVVSIMEGGKVTFDGRSSTDKESGVGMYRFMFGDGEESGYIGVSTFDHSYRKAGTYTATLRVKDKTGHESEPTTISILVTPKSSGGGGGGGGGDDPTDGSNPSTWDKLRSGVVSFYKSSYFPWFIVALIALIAIGAGAAVARRSRKNADARRSLEESVDYAPLPRTMPYQQRPARPARPDHAQPGTAAARPPAAYNIPSDTAYYGETEATPMYAPSSEATAPYSQPEMTWDSPAPTSPSHAAVPPPLPPAEAGVTLPSSAPAAPKPAAPPQPAKSAPAPAVPPPKPLAAPPADAPAMSKPATSETPKQSAKVDSDIADILKRLESISGK